MYTVAQSVLLPDSTCSIKMFEKFRCTSHALIMFRPLLLKILSQELDI